MVLKSFELTPGATSLAVANAAGNLCSAASQSSPQKLESLCPGIRDPHFQEECRQDPVFLQQVCSLERMLRVKTSTESASLPSSSVRGCAGENSLEDHDIAGAQFPKRIKALEGCSEVCEASGVSDVGNCQSSRSHGISHLSHDVDSSVVNSVSVSPVSAPLSLFLLLPPLLLLGCLLLVVPLLLVRLVVSRVVVHVWVVVALHGLHVLVGVLHGGGVEGGLSRSCFSPLQSMHVRDDANSCLDTVNLLKVQHSTSYNLQGVVTPNSRRKVTRSCPGGNRSAELTVDMSPAPVAGTCVPSASQLHEQRQVTRSSVAYRPGSGPGPGPGSGAGGGWSGLVGGAQDHAAACVGIPCSLVMPPGRHQFAPQSLGWARVCGTERSGVWVLKGDARTCNLPWNLDDVGVVWERGLGHARARLFMFIQLWTWSSSATS